MKRSASPQPAQLPISPEPAPNITPFPYRDYLSAKSEIEAALRGRPFYALVTGASGVGKTSLARELSASLDRSKHQFLYLPTPRVSLLPLVRCIAQVLGLAARRSALETIKVISDHLRSQPTHLVAWIDEAAGIPENTLGELRLLAEFNHEVPQVFSIVLSGPPELRTTLDQPSLFPLKRRVTVRCTLEGLRRDELDPFLLHRFSSAEARRIPLGLRDELFERTRAVPALLDRVVRSALDRAGKGAVTDESLKEALDVAGL